MVFADVLTPGTNWLQGLSPEQIASIEHQLAQGKGYEEIARAWLPVSHAASRQPLAAEGITVAMFYDRFMLEVEDFICREDKYADEKQKILSQFQPGDVLIVGAISTVLSPLVGASAPVLAPLVALMLMTLAKMGKNAWCELRQELRREEPAPQPQ